MPDDDPILDSALAALAGVEPGLEDDDRWAKRVASRVSTFAPPSRRELDPFLAAPFPDDHQDFDQPAHAADDHGHAAAAADFGDARGWEGSMSEDESTSRPPNSLAALSGLTRSGPSTSNEPLEGAAKGDDSGLIDLRAMSQPEPEPAAPQDSDAAAAAAPVAASEKAPPVTLKGEKTAVAASTAPAAVPPSSTTATAASAPAATPRSEQKKGGAVIWLALGGVAAAAAVALFTVGPLAKKDEASTAQAPEGAQPAEKKAEKVAAADKPAATTEPAPQASAAPAATEEPHEQVAAKPGGAATGTAAAKAGTGPIDPKAAATTKPSAETKPTAEAPKSAGTGSLDEVLGIGKDQPTKTASPTDNLPDKPDSMDVRSAINGKLSAANACVKGLEGPSNASVTFGPSGAVSGVVITSGPAKGTGAESCVKGAFSSAKVPPSKKGASGSATLMP